MPSECDCRFVGLGSKFQLNYVEMSLSFHYNTRRDLRFNKIRQLPRGSFSTLPALHTLLLNNNNVRKLKSGAFDGLGELKYLYLYKNHISYVEEDVFKELHKLEHL